MEDSLKKWYKDRSYRLKAIAPNSAWENIAQNLDAEEKEAYTDFLNPELNAAQRPGNWESIANKLDAIELQRKAKYWSYVRSAMVAVSLIALPWLLNDGIVLKTENTPVQLTEISPEMSENKIDKNNQLVPLIQVINEPNLTIRQDLSVFNTLPLVEIERAHPELALFCQPRMDIRANLLPVEPLDQNYNRDLALSGIIAERKNYDRTPLGVWQYGMRAGMHRSSHLNPLTIRSGSLDLKNNVIPSYSLGLGALLDVNSVTRIGLETTFTSTRTNGLKDKYGNEIYSASIKDLTVQSSYQYSLSRFTFMNRNNMFLTGGVYASLNLESDVQLLGYKLDFRQFDAGVTVGLLYSKQVNERIRFTTEFRYQQGLINQFKGGYKLPPSFFRSHTSNISGLIGVYYRL